MSGPSFKFGDRVYYGHHKGTVISVAKQGFSYNCRIKFDNPNLIPPEMDCDQVHLKFIEPNEEVCPKCGSRWNVIRFNMKVWKDCISCGKTKEDLLKETSEPPSLPSINELAEEIQKILDDDDDYNDDFGTFVF